MTGLGANPPVLYLTGASQGFVIGTDVSATFGSLELQMGGPFSNASLSGPYAYGTEGGDVGRRVTAVGTMRFDGTSTEGTEDDAVAAGLMPDQSWSGVPYAFAGDGRGTLDAQGHTVGYIVSPGKLVYINTPAGRPRLVIVEK